MRTEQPGALSGRSLGELFMAQVRRQPDRPAIAGADGQVSYAELGSLVEQFARGLRRLRLPTGAMVGVAGDRGRDACVAMIGAVYAGLGYVPLDPSLPAERLHTMVTDSGAVAVIRLPGAKAVDGRTLEFADILDLGRHGTDGPTPQPDTTPAYVMFTSGTSGRPKAVAIPQRGVARLSIDNGFLDIEPTDRVLHACSLSFDASVLEMWPTLLNGACLVPVPSDVLLSAPALHALLQRERISVLFLTTSIFHHMAAEQPELFAGLRYAITGGEALQTEAARRVLEHGRPAHLVNAYGPTEAACVATAHVFTAVSPDSVGVPIGVPIADTACHVVRPDGTLAVDGEDGELCVAGGGIATGYLNAPKESADRFVRLPVGRSGELVPVYRTGDVVRRRADGVLEFVGRRDDQVKIRGFRIEPGEIRAVLTSHPNVGDAAVVVRGEGATRVLAAYVATAGSAPDAQDLQGFLRARLPEYMVPATVTVLDRLPLTASGKLDHTALPTDTTTSEALGSPGSVAETVAAIWASVLPSGHAQPDDDFFAGGGNSLLAVQLVAQVQEQLGLDDEHNYLLITNLLNEPTIRAFTSTVENVWRTGSAEDAHAATADRWRPDIVWDVPEVTHAGPEPDWRNPRHVFLTGATGFLGAHLLRELLDQTDAQIHTLVRGRDMAHAYSRLAEAQRRYGIDRPLPEERVSPVLGDLAKPRLGLADADWEQQAAHADVIHHCGAEVNFLYPYEKLRVANVFGTQEILRLAARRAIPVHHVSTLAVVHGMGAAGLRRVTEDTPLDNVELLGMGYPESKWVAEEVVRGAASAGLPTVIHRPYEISGDATGFTWNSGAALCELFRIITELELAPDLDLALNLVPVDYVAASIVHIGLTQPADGQTYHLVNPREAMLSDLVDRLRAHGHRIHTVGYPAWIEEMLAYLADRPGHPFTPLTQLYTKRVTPEITLQELACARITPQLDRSRLDAAEAGSGLACPPVDRELLDGYVRYFHDSGFIVRPTAALERAGHA
ncbi:amino acid adenylation domain-containing protein [Kibdelosporangium aridum]|uniref:Amino acid adenylation domain-containing protein n=1 Tax=Kibdelosporangium aridum TaxID=2030 RepID=A0A428ZU09_KIBAR|nr:amino acid adenylation domain-containing protein [Kibdelosporangium aridum]RSM91501.1 amino acid adenylation domain-containing protein [Kibdelosporangium aridum]